jgi:DNA polymerase-1
MLKSWGTGSVIGEGELAGISVAARLPDGFLWKAYLPIAHFGGGNIDRGIVAQYLREVCGRTDCNYIFLNAGYDLLWLRTIGVEVRGTITDIGVVEALIDEENPAGYGLDEVAWRRIGRRKDEQGLRDAAQAYSLNDPKMDMWKLPAHHVGPYSEADAEITLLSWEAQKAEIEKQDLRNVLKLEQAVTPILADMHWQGIPVNINYATELNDKWKRDEDALLRGLNLSLDDLWNSERLAAIALREGLAPGKTAKTGQYSITKDWLAEMAKLNPRMRDILQCRAVNRCRTVYLEQNLIRNVRKGRIFPEYVQLAMDDGFEGFGGTRTGRLACKNPNAQQFPKRSHLFDAKALRYALVPEGGRWSKGDYWSQEPVLQCHYGLLLGLEGAETVRRKFVDGVKLYTFIEEATSGACDYGQAKEVALGRSYGMGAPKMSRRMGISLDKCYEVLEAFDKAVPFVKMLANDTSNLAKRRGYIKTLSGRRRHFNKWTAVATREERAQGVKYDAYDSRELAQAGYEAQWREMNPGMPPPPRQFEHAFAYKALNALIQGGAADQTKTALVHMKQAGIMPRMTVHDEISAFLATEKEHKMHEEIMKNCVNLLAPVRADMSFGDHWQ